MDALIADLTLFSRAEAKAAFNSLFDPDDVHEGATLLRGDAAAWSEFEERLRDARLTTCTGHLRAVAVTQKVGGVVGKFGPSDPSALPHWVATIMGHLDATYGPERVPVVALKWRDGRPILRAIVVPSDAGLHARQMLDPSYRPPSTSRERQVPRQQADDVKTKPASAEPPARTPIRITLRCQAVAEGVAENESLGTLIPPTRTEVVSQDQEDHHQVCTGLFVPPIVGVVEADLSADQHVTPPRPCARAERIQCRNCDVQGAERCLSRLSLCVSADDAPRRGCEAQPFSCSDEGVLCHMATPMTGSRRYAAAIPEQLCSWNATIQPAEVCRENLAATGQGLHLTEPIAQHVAAAPDRLDVVLALAGVGELLAQLADEDVDDLQLGLVHAAVEVVEEHLLRQGRALPEREEFQHLVLLAGEVHPRAGDLDGLLVEVDDEVARRDHGLGVALRAAHDRWAYENSVTLDFSRPGKPTDTVLVESFNGRLRDECLNTNWFLSLADAKGKIEAWRRQYNESRPHTARGWRTPQEFALAAARRAAE